MGEPNPSGELKQIRGKLGLSQAAFARALSLENKTYERYERGETKKVPAAVMDAARKLAGKK